MQKIHKSFCLVPFETDQNKKKVKTLIQNLNYPFTWQ